MPEPKVILVASVFCVLVLIGVGIALFKKRDNRTPFEKRRDILDKEVEKLKPPTGYMNGKYTRRPMKEVWDIFEPEDEKKKNEIAL